MLEKAKTIAVDKSRLKLDFLVVIHKKSGTKK